MRLVKFGWACALLTLLLVAPGRAFSALQDALAPDLVLHNAKIVTVDRQFSIAQAVAIKDGRFVAVGSNDEILALAGSRTHRMDLEGRTVLPGLNDSHLHLTWPVGEVPEPLLPRLVKAASIQEVLDIVRQKVAATPAGKPVWFSDGPSRAG